MSRNDRANRRGGRGAAGSATRASGAIGIARDRGRNRLRPDLLVLEDRRLLATFTVNTTFDNVDNNGNPLPGTFRWAAQQANLAASPSTIVFSLGSSPVTITLGQLLKPVELTNTTQPITIQGPGAGLVTIDGHDEGSILRIDPNVTATVTGLKFTNASLDVDNNNGAISNFGTLTISNCTLSGNTIAGLYDKGTATISDCISSNNNNFFGAGFFVAGNATITSCTITDNKGARGAGICNQGTTTVTSCTITGDSALGGGGGLYNSGTLLKVYSSTISGVTGGGGGGLFNDKGTAYLSGCTISNGSGFINGGALDNEYGATLKVVDCTVASSSAITGAGLYNAGNATLTDCTITGNTSTGTGGGIASGPLQNKAVLVLTGSTITGNTAKQNGAGVFNNGTATLTDDTIAGNFANQAGSLLASDGGGVDNSGTATLVACTITGNTTTASGGGVYNGGLGANSLTLNDTIVAGNTTSGGGANDIEVGSSPTGPYNVKGSSNLVGTGGAGGLSSGTNQLGVVNTGLGTLGYYGGPTPTIPPLAGSPAIAAGSKALEVGPQNQPLTTDQRGFPLDSPNPDIGAFQTSSAPLVVKSTGDGSAVPLGELSLREAVALAGLRTRASNITFDATAFAAPQTIVLTAGPIELSNTAAAITITGPPAGVTISGNQVSRVFQVDKDVMATITGLTITGGATSSGDGSYGAGNGGGLLNLGTTTLNNCTISGNSAGVGGGLYNFGTATLTGSTISGNSASSKGGGVYDRTGTISLTGCTVSGDSSAAGAGLFLDGPATLTDTTVSGNTGGDGIENTGALTLVDSTIAGNAVRGLNNQFGQATLIACTITGNGDYGLANYRSGSSGAIALTDTIVAGNTLNGNATDIGGTDPADITGSYNLVGTGGSGGLAAAQNNLIGVAKPGLSALGLFGGAAPTIGLLPGSPAIGAGLATTDPQGHAITTDERGLPLDAPAPDIGAFQSQGFTLAAIAGSTPQSAAVRKAFANPLGVTVTPKNASDPVAGGVVTFAVTPNANGASANLSSLTAAIGSNGAAQVGATANATAGSYAVTASAAGAAAPVTFSLSNVIPLSYSGLSNPTIRYGSMTTFSGTLSGSGGQAPVGESVLLTVDGVSQSATIASGGSFSATLDTSHLSVLGSPYTVTYAYTGDGTYAAANTTGKLTVTQATPQITWSNPADITYGTALSGTQLDATSAVPGTFAYTPSSGTILHAGSNQTLSVTFTPTDTTDYATVTATATINVAKATPSITWSNPADIAFGTALGAAQLDATSPVPGAFSYTPAAGTILHAGSNQTLSVTFTPNDTADYDTNSATVSINVAKPTPAIAWSNPADITYGTALGAAQLDASVGVPGSLAYTPAAGTVLNAGAGQTLSVTFTPTDTADYNGNTATVTINVAKATPTITWPNPADISFGTALGPSQLDASASWTVGASNQTVTGTFAYTPAAGTVLNQGPGQTLSVTFTPADTADYNGTTATAKINVGKSAPAITWSNPADITYGTPLSSTQLDASSPIPGTFVYTPAAGTVLKAGSDQTLSVTFTPNDTADYATVTLTAKINVARATPTITWPNPADITFGTPLGSGQLDATANVPGTFAYNPGPGTVLGSGTGQTLSVTFTPQDSTDYSSITVKRTINVGQATPDLVVSAPGGTYDGSPFPASVSLGGSGNAPAASLEGTPFTLTYYLGTGTTGRSLGSTPPTAPGTYTVVAGFPGTADYRAAQSQPVTFTIAKGTPTIALASSSGSPAPGQAVTLVATVSPAAPGEMVTFYDGSTPLGTAPIDGSGKAMLTTTALSAGANAITASFAGDADLLGATSAALAESVGKVGTRVVFVPKPVFKRKKIISLNLEAQVLPTSAVDGVPTGSVTFELQVKKKHVTEQVLGTAALNGGTATLAVKPNAVLKKPLTIVYGGDAGFLSSTANEPALSPSALKGPARPMVALQRRGHGRH